MWLTLAIVTAVVLRVWSLWSLLPDTMGSHYGFSGRADSYMSKESFFLVMGLVGGGSLAALLGGSALIRWLPPRLINVPNRDYWFANKERREIAIGRIAESTEGMSVATAALLAVAIELVVQANLRHSSFDNRTFLIALAAYLGFAVYILVKKIRLLEVPKGS